ncbi:MAG: flagellar hook protein FlgE [Nitrospiria bacterium]
MAILTSLFSGVSGLNAFGTGLSVVSNNIANLNTVGFKDSSVSFSDIIGQNLGGATGTSQVGRGVFVNQVRTLFSQGSFETTGNALDMAIDGEGFFVLKNTSGAEFYSRAGIFNVNQNGLVENPEGLLLQGFQADPAGNLTGQVGDINLAASTFPPLASSRVDMVANIDSRASIPGAFDVNNPSSTSNFSSAITVYDSLGNEHLVNVYFRKSAEAATGNSWEYFAVVDMADATSGNREIQAQGTLTFGTDGALRTESAVTYPLASGGFDFSGGPAQGQNILFDFGNSIVTDTGTGLDGMTQFGSNSAIFNQTQDGFSSGALQRISINKEGIVTGLFTNGKSRALSQLILSRFNNQQGLSNAGNNLYTVSSESGQPLKGVANSAGVGRVLSSALEGSNVDLAEQFVRMISYQRGFQANSRVITSSDEILQELVNLKR